MEERQNDHHENRRKRFYPSISLGNIIAAIAFVSSGIGIYTSLAAQVDSSKNEIVNIKGNIIRQEAVEREYREEMKAQVKEVKQDIKDVQKDVQKVLIELGRSRK